MRIAREHKARAALTAIATVQTVMLAALMTRAAPHPPDRVIAFAIAPFLGASLAIALAAIVMGPTRSRAGKVLAVIAGLCALVSFGPHKFFDAQIVLIWPAVLTAQVFVIVILVAVFDRHSDDG